jgi:nicotinate-nucleotide adenylyltransferase
MHVGLFFGSFNPIHVGHLAIANHIVEFTDMEQVWFVVSPHNPLKNKSSLLSDHHRLSMVRVAIEGDLRFRASDVEFKMPKPSYTIDTLVWLREQFPQHQFSIIMGTDGLPTFDKWKNFEELINTTTRYIYPRPGFDYNTMPFTQNSVLVNAPQIDISSTFIRESIKKGHNMHFFLHEKTWEYLDEMRFYR